MNTFTQIFLIALAAGALTQMWLYLRHAGHVYVHREQVPEAFVEKITQAEHHKAADYTLAKVRLGQIELVIGTVTLLIWTLGGALDLLLDAWRGSGLPPLLSDAVAPLSLFLIQGVLDQPISLWRTFRLEERFGFNRITAGRYIKDILLGLVLALALGGPLILAVLWLMRGAGDYWWLYAWAVWMGFSLLMTWIFPTLIAPLFNKFTPLEDGELRSRIDGLLHRCGFSSRGIFVMDGSRRSSHGNAYFTGFGRNKRIVFFDTLMGGLGADELEAVLAHELGHFKRHHVRKGLVLSSILGLLGFALLGWLAQQTWFYTGLGVSTASDPAALLLFLLVSPVFTQFLSPFGAWLMRRYEYEADDYAVEHTGGAPLIRALVKLYQDNASTLTPDPLYSAFHDSHPPAPVRIAHISSRMTSNREPTS